MTKTNLKRKKLTIEEERGLHQRLARRLSKQMADTHSVQWVGLAHGSVIAAAPAIREVTAPLAQVEPDPRRRLVFKAGEDYRKRVIIVAMRIAREDGFDGIAGKPFLDNFHYSNGKGGEFCTKSWEQYG